MCMNIFRLMNQCTHFTCQMQMTAQNIKYVSVLKQLLELESEHVPLQIGLQEVCLFRCIFLMLYFTLNQDVLHWYNVLTVRVNKVSKFTYNLHKLFYICIYIVLGSLDDRHVEVMVMSHSNKSLLFDIVSITGYNVTLHIHTSMYMCMHVHACKYAIIFTTMYGYTYIQETGKCLEEHDLNTSNLFGQAEVNLTTNGSIESLHHNHSFVKFNLSIPSAPSNNIVFTNISLYNSKWPKTI